MRQATRDLWSMQDRHPGDRWSLFKAVADALPGVRAVLYPGSFVDVAPSFVFDDVTYVDTDRRAARFFADADGVLEIVAEHAGKPSRIAFLPADYTSDLDVGLGSVDLLISLYAGPVSAHCTRYLRIGGNLLVNPSHGDAALASLDSRYALAGAVVARGGGYVVRADDLGSYLVPKRADPITREEVLRSGRGIPYERPAFAYIFTRVA